MTGDLQLSNGERIGRSVLLFLDPAAIAARIDEPVRRKQMLGGYHIRQLARRRLRKRKRSSSPGESPSAHSDKLRGGIVFARDPSTGAVRVGPQFESQSSGRQSSHTTEGTIPQVLEFGGRISLVEQQRPVKGQVIWTHPRRPRPGDESLPTRRRTVLIAARPYMVPALKTGLDRLPELFVNLL